MKSFAVALFLAGQGVDAGHTLTNCGKAGDHMKHVQVMTSPDPIVKGQPFTMHATAVLDEALAEGSIALDFNVELLNIINQKIQSTNAYKYSPGIPKGQFGLVIGPVTLPYLPFTNKLTGTIKMANSKKEPIGCIGVNLDLLDVAVPAPNVSEGITSCTSANAHMKQFSWTTTNGLFKLTGNLDEDVEKFTAKVAAQVHVGWIPVPINVDVPLQFLPGFKKGPFLLTLDNKTTIRSPEVDATVTGTIKVNDKNDEEIVCLNLAGSSADETMIV